MPLRTSWWKTVPVMIIWKVTSQMKVVRPVYTSMQVGFVPIISAVIQVYLFNDP